MLNLSKIIRKKCCQMQYFSISKAAKYLGLNPMTLRRWEKDGRIKPLRTQGGQRRYTKYMLDCAYIDEPAVNTRNPYAIGYCRVPEAKYKSTLEKQKKAVSDYLNVNGLPYEIIARIAPDNDFGKNGIHALVQKICTDSCVQIVAAMDACISQDVLEFKLFKEICNAHDVKLVFIDKNKHVK